MLLTLYLVTGCKMKPTCNERSSIVAKDASAKQRLYIVGLSNGLYFKLSIDDFLSCLIPALSFLTTIS